MYIGDNKLNDHDDNFSPKKCFTSNLNYALAFWLHFQNLRFNFHASCL